MVMSNYWKKACDAIFNHLSQGCLQYVVNRLSQEKLWIEISFLKQCLRQCIQRINYGMSIRGAHALNCDKGCSERHAQLLGRFLVGGFLLKRKIAGP